MNRFLKPTKFKLLMFLIVTIIIISSLFLISFGPGNFELIIFYYIFWLRGLVENITNISLTKGGGDYIPEPNTLGWIFIIIGALIPLLIYYLIACTIVYFIEKKKIK